MTKRIYREPFFIIKLEEKTLGVDDALLIDKIKIEDHKENVHRASFQITDSNFVYQDIFRENTAISIQVGYLEGETYVFTGEIRKLKYKFPADGVPILMVECDSLLKSFIEDQKQVVWENRTRSSIVAELAVKYGLKPYVKKTTVIIPFETQPGITDAALIRKLADREGFLFNVRGGTLYWGPEGTGRKDKQVLSYRVDGKEIKSADLGFNVENEARGVSANQISELEGSVITATATDEDLNQGSDTTTNLATQFALIGLPTLESDLPPRSDISQGEFEIYQGTESTP